MDSDGLEHIPYFIIPANDERSVLFSERLEGRHVRAQLFECNDGRRLFTLDMYFGTVLVWPTDSEYEDDLLTGVIDACHAKASPDKRVVRLDYAYDCLTQRFMLLRFGLPKSTPIPYSELDPDALRDAERYIERFMKKPHIDILAERLQAIGDESILFDGEETFLEGFLGDSGLPLVLPEELATELDVEPESTTDHVS